MSAASIARALELAVLLAASRDLAEAFRHDPFARTAPAALVVWLIGCASLRRANRPGSAECTAALALGALSGVIAVHAVAHAGLALWCVGAVRAPRTAVLAAVCWMPALGHAASWFGPAGVGLLRLAIALAWLGHARRYRRG